ncbi:MAG TPA: hypothetical protein VFR86_27730 [Burkholderiaceae bacterium]|nr:hypothetical protein [Burkholderiaceae bacterium]
MVVRAACGATLRVVLVLGRLLGVPALGRLLGVPALGRLLVLLARLATGFDDFFAVLGRRAIDVSSKGARGRADAAAALVTARFEAQGRGPVPGREQSACERWRQSPFFSLRASAAASPTPLMMSPTWLNACG